jgi:hypothetical protein
MQHKPKWRRYKNMALKTKVYVERMLDRGPEYGFLEVQVNFEEEPSATKGTHFAFVVVSLAKTEVGGMPLDDIRALALSKALSFMKDCTKGSDSN